MCASCQWYFFFLNNVYSIDCNNDKRYTDVVSPARQRGQQNRGQETFHDANHPALQSPLRAAPPVRMVCVV